jgi:putative tryptophan/tyrosine transport system substrate-binding protein
MRKTNLMASSLKCGLIVIICGLLFMAVSCQKVQDPVSRIGILQDKPQEWADALKLGFNDGLVEQGMDIGKDVVVVSRSASGDPQAFTTIAETFANGDYAVIYTLGTQATQEIISRTKTKPIIFGAVTDPVAAGLFQDDLSHPKANITGTQDLWPYPAQFTLIQTLQPQAKRIGIVYNGSEINSQVSVRFIKDECKKRNLLVEERTVTGESELQTAVAAILSKGIDAFFIPADNTAQTASATILALCNQQKVPVFTGIPGIVENGALATVGTNYYQLGKVNAKQAVQILKENKKASGISVSIADQGDVYINLKTAKSLNITVPADVLKKAVKVYE